MHLLKPGQEFVGRYRIERALARGGMAAVFVGEQIATEMPVAIKVLYPHILTSKDAVEKFELEAKIAARIQSDHIVRVVDAGYDRETDSPFLVMELLEGQDLHSLVEQKGPLSLDKTAEIIRQVAAGLDRAHGYINRAGVPEPIVHRDLKPENLFLARRDSGEAIVKILDFGIAKVLTDTASISQEVKGTPLFMAREQITGGVLSPQTDIWALGLVTFFLLTGRTYWKAGTNPGGGVSTLFAEILNQPLDPPSERIVHKGGSPPWPAAFDAWFLRCVARNPGARYDSAGEAARELFRALDRPLESEPATLVESRPEPNSSGIVARRASVAAPQHEPIAEARTTDAPGSRRSRRVAWAAIGTFAAALLVGAGIWRLLQSTGVMDTGTSRGQGITLGAAIPPAASSTSKAQPTTGVSVAVPAINPVSASVAESAKPPQQPPPQAPTRVPQPATTPAPGPVAEPRTEQPPPKPIDVYEER